MLFSIALMLAAPSAAPCPAGTTPPAGWNARGAVGTIGRAFVLAGRDDASASTAKPYASGPNGGRASHSGGVASAPITIATPGTYRVSIDEAAWIDLLSDGKPLRSTAHAHGAACSGVVKTVDFHLDAGRYTLRVSGLKTHGVRVLIATAG